MRFGSPPAQPQDETQRLVAELRTKAEPICVERLADQLQVRLIVHRFAGPVRGAAVAGDTILLDAELSPFERRWTFAHEVGHILLQRDHLRVSRGVEELFADQFARELLLPRGWVEGVSDVPAFARRVGVARWLVALQMAVVGRAPRLQRDGSSVLCATCGHREHAPPCVCQGWRRRSPHQRRKLPHVRDIPGWRSCSTSPPKGMTEQLRMTHNSGG